MNKASTQSLELLPSPEKLQSICKSISSLEAILSPEWQYRTLSYQKDWSDKEEFSEIRNGSGDHVLILFSPYGCVINGFAHESAMNGWRRVELEDKRNFIQKIFKKNAEPKFELAQEIWPGLLDNLPKEFHEFIFGEPVRSIGTTFCIWSLQEDEKWKIGEFEFPDHPYLDGSTDLLELLDGKPKTYVDWAKENYELEDMDLEVVTPIYEKEPISKSMVNKLNPDLEDFDQLKSDLAEIGYPHLF